MTRIRQHPVYLTILALLWVILQGELDLSNVLVGYAVGIVVLGASGLGRWERAQLRHPWTALRLVGRFLLEIGLANLRIAWLVVQPRLRLYPAFLTLPLQLRGDIPIATLANMITLTPGTLTVDVAEDGSHLIVHCLSTRDPDAVARDIKNSFERPLAECLQCSPLP